MKRLIPIALLMAACSAPEKKEPEVIENRGSVSEADREMPLPGPVQTPPPAVDAEPDTSNVEVFQLKMGETYNAMTGIAVTLVDVVAAPGKSTLVVDFSDGEQSAQLEHSGSPAYLEGVVFDALYTVSIEGDLVMATLTRDLPSAPIDIATAGGIAAEHFNERPDCGSATAMGSKGQRNGTLLVFAVNGETVVCQVQVGLYTRRVID